MKARTLVAATAAAIFSLPAAARAADTCPAGRPLVTCPAEQQKVGKNARPDKKLVTHLIQCLWEKPASPGMDGATTVDVNSLEFGSTRAARVTDYGARDNNATIHPALVRYTMTTFYRSRTVTRQDEAVFNCHVDSFGSWQCGLSETRVRGQSKDSPPINPAQ